MSFRIFAGNLAFQVTDEDLREAFAAYGTVTYARVILDRDTGKSRGFGFVEIDGDDAGKRALDGLNGSQLKGRQLRLREAEPRGGGRHEGGPPRRHDRPSAGARPPRAGTGPPPGAPPVEDAGQRRRSEPKRSHKPKEGTDERRGFGPHGSQGRPQEKERGGAKNRFIVDDDDDDDIDLFGKYHEEEDYDVSSIDGVEISDEDEEPGGIQIPIEPDKKE